MAKFIRAAIDLGKNYFQVHLESEGGRSVSRKVKRSKMHEVYSQIEPCRVGMEACGSAHYWARQLIAMGHEVVLIPPAYVKPYVKRGKNDVVDAAAICEAMSRPDMRFVPVKSADQQAVLMLLCQGLSPSHRLKQHSRGVCRFKFGKHERRDERYGHHRKPWTPRQRHEPQSSPQ